LPCVTQNQHHYTRGPVVTVKLHTNYTGCTYTVVHMAHIKQEVNIRWQ